MNITTTYDEALVKAMIAEAVAKEREECAKACEVNHHTTRRNMDSFECAAAIRARSNT